MRFGGEGRILFIFAFATFLFCDSARAISNGQIDDFQNGTLQSWANGAAMGAPPVQNISTGGPTGAGDRYMLVTADGEDAGQFLTVFNRNQWLGNYIAAGVTAIEVDLRNQGDVELNIRIAFKQGTGISAPGYVSTNPFFIAAGNNGWLHAIFLIDPGSLTPLNGPSDFNTFFSSGIAEMRFINATNDDGLNGDTVVSQLGIDNIHAVPEPTVALLGGAGLLLLGAICRRQAC